MIELFTKKINDNLMYINLDGTSWDNFTFQGAPNFSRLNTIQFKMNSDIEQNMSIKILTPNVLMYDNSLAGLRWVAKKIEEQVRCPISYEYIGENECYKTCAVCKRHFENESIDKWLETNNTNSCPLCRSTWTDFTTYINTTDTSLYTQTQET